VTWKSWGGTNRGAVFGHASVYEQSYFKKLLRLAGVTGAPLNMLEIGFGNGGLLAYCKNQGHAIVGTEANGRLVEMARSSGYEAFAADFIETSPPDSFDLIVALDVIEHIEPAQTVAFLQACQRILKPGGRLVLRFPNGDSPFSASNFNADVTHVNWISADKMRYYAQMSSFASMKIQGTPQIILTKSLVHGFYNLCNVPAKWLLNVMYRLLFYPGRPLNFVAIDLVAILKR
jgi:2-polyprenyl-3-methyl-5-hydroxy-6-metoxy-1,4-benzoquinol methylase